MPGAGAGAAHRTIGAGERFASIDRGKCGYRRGVRPGPFGTHQDGRGQERDWRAARSSPTTPAGRRTSGSVRAGDITDDPQAVYAAAQGSAAAGNSPWHAERAVDYTALPGVTFIGPAIATCRGCRAAA